MSILGYDIAQSTISGAGFEAFESTAGDFTIRDMRFVDSPKLVVVRAGDLVAERIEATATAPLAASFFYGIMLNADDPVNSGTFTYSATIRDVYIHDIGITGTSPGIAQVIGVGNVGRPSLLQNFTLNFVIERVTLYNIQAVAQVYGINVGGVVSASGASTVTGGILRNTTLTQLSAANGTYPVLQAGIASSASVANIEVIADIVNVTIVDNTQSGPDIQPYGAGGITNLVWGPNGPNYQVLTRVQNVLLANNTVRGGGANCALGNFGGTTAMPTMSSLGGNIATDTTCSSYYTQASDQNAVSQSALVLQALADNGGLTPTVALGDGSVAIDVGVCTGAPATDQRGVPRPTGAGCESGTYEYEDPESNLVVPILSGASEDSLRLPRVGQFAQSTILLVVILSVGLYLFLLARRKHWRHNVWLPSKAFIISKNLVIDYPQRIVRRKPVDGPGRPHVH